MAKTKEELNALKKEAQTLNKQFAKLDEKDLEQVSGGIKKVTCPKEAEGYDESWCDYMDKCYFKCPYGWKNKYVRIR